MLHALGIEAEVRVRGGAAALKRFIAAAAARVRARVQAHAMQA